MGKRHANTGLAASVELRLVVLPRKLDISAGIPSYCGVLTIVINPEDGGQA